MTIYERLGGDQAVTAMLDGLYARATSDPLFLPFFEKIDMNRLRSRQHLFIAKALGGPQQYSAPSLVHTHSRLAIEQRHFDAFVAHLRDSLIEMRVPAELITEIMAMVEPLAPLIVNTPGLRVEDMA
jgi:hemoglobin